jgi:16S rRNA (uracil1498-N3)-methyltransferase
MGNDLIVPVGLLSSIRIGALVTVRAEDGLESRARVVRVEHGMATVRIFEVLDFPTESPLHLTLVQALPKREKMSLVIEKSVELGVNTIAPCYSAKSEDSTLQPKGQDRSHRWPLVVARAVEQCRRRTVPDITPLGSLAEVIESLAAEVGPKIMLYEKEPAARLRDMVSTTERPTRAVVVCGPEGGFTEEEVIHARGNGFVPVRLGGRLLRCETAAIAAISIIQHVWGDM